jgi:hypothetical protein
MKGGLIPRTLLLTSPPLFGGTRIRLRKLLIVAGVFFLMSPGLLMGQDNEGKEPFLPTPVRSVSTVPANGDINPYGVAFVPHHLPPGGTVNPGDILISNFNNSNNLQGTGTTIVRVPASGSPSVFFQGQAPLGLSTALNILRKGFVLVGNFPSTDGTCQNSSAGSILVIDKSGNLVSTISNSLINGPWDSALFDKGDSAKFFVANGLTGTVVRLDLAVSASGVTMKSITQIASGYGFQCDTVTFVDAPTSLVYNRNEDVLYVASTVDNAVFAVDDAAKKRHDEGTGRVIYTDSTHLHGPLGMIQAPNGHLVVSNNDVVNSDPNQPSEIVEFTIEGKFVKQISVDPAQGGSFGLAVASSGDVARFAAVDDNASVLLIWTLELP